eukprot:8734046-Pyramimonas_sp.AAC.1
MRGPGGYQGVPGGPGGSWGVPGRPRGSQGVPGGSQGVPGGPRGSRKVPGDRSNLPRDDITLSPTKEYFTVIIMDGALTGRTPAGGGDRALSTHGPAGDRRAVHPRRLLRVDGLPLHPHQLPHLRRCAPSRPPLDPL